MKKIIVLGDSFTYGHGCSDREFYYDPRTGKWVGDILSLDKGPSNYCWASLLQRYYSNYQVINLSKPANDNSYMLIDAYKNTDEKTALIIYSGTMQSRMHISGNSSDDIIAWVMGSDDTINNQQIRDAKEQFIKYLYNETVFSISALNSLYAAYGLAMKCNAKFIWSAPTWDLLEHENQANRLIDMKVETAIYYRNKEPDCRATDNHLNDKGHSLYFNEVILPKVKQSMEQK
jgi:hypothetical protein